LTRFDDPRRVAEMMPVGNGGKPGIAAGFERSWRAPFSVPGRVLFLLSIDPRLQQRPAAGNRYALSFLLIKFLRGNRRNR
jgi:hypothetical protein